jgi:hypothetical protein
VGDPSFTGFYGQRFIFTGLPFVTYHIFSDPWISLDTEFGPALGAKSDGTVVKIAKLRFGSHNLTLNRDWRQGATVRYELDGKVASLSSGKSVSVGECFTVSCDKNRITWSSQVESLTFVYDTAANSHINTTFFDLRFDVPLNEPDSCGGLLGQTAKEDGIISTAAELFVVPPSGFAPSSRFKQLDACRQK